MASESERGNEIELAEKPKEGESWRGMVERQQKEETNLGGYMRELLRSLPAEQKEEKERGSSFLMPDDHSQMAEVPQQSFEEAMRVASQRGGPEPSQELER